MSRREVGIEEARKRLGDLVTAVQQGTDIILTRNGKPAARLIRMEDAMDTTTLPPLSDGTRAAVANLVDYTIEREYGQDTPGMAGARTVALGGLQMDLLDSGAPQDGIQGHAETVLRILVRDGLAARVCQCQQLHPHGCPHGAAVGQLFCGSHYEADVPEIGGALLCGTCHVVEYQARA